MLRIDSVHDNDEYLSMLESSNVIYIDHERLCKAVRDARYRANDYRNLALTELKIESAGAFYVLGKDDLIEFLLKAGVDLDKRFRNRKVAGYSLDQKKVIDPMIENGIFVDLLTYYKSFKSYKSYSAFLSQLYSDQKLFKQTSDGRYILGYPTEISERSNARFYYHDIAVVSIPKIYSSIVTTPGEGYHIAWCDYPQADWRFAYNLFIKDESNVDIMSKCEDAYEGLARIIEGDEFDSEEFKESRKQYKVSCLSTFYNSQDKDKIPSAMRAYFNSRDRYSRYVYDLNILHKFRLPIQCTSYFGFTQVLPESPYNLDAYLSKGLNTPIQTFTSHVVTETVFGILQRFWDLGYTKEDINVYYVRHDEPLFIFKDTILKDAWVFKDCSLIKIDGFTPIKLDFHFGDFYTEEDEYLTSKIHQEMEKYPENIHIYPEGEMKDYYPIARVECVYVQFRPSDDGEYTKIRVYNYRDGKHYFFKSPKLTPKDALYTALPEIIYKLGNPQYLLIYNDSIIVHMDYAESIAMDQLPEDEQQTLFKVVSKYDASVVKLNAENPWRDDT